MQKTLQIADRQSGARKPRNQIKPLAISKDATRSRISPNDASTHLTRGDPSPPVAVMPTPAVAASNPVSRYPHGAWIRGHHVTSGHPDIFGAVPCPVARRPDIRRRRRRGRRRLDYSRGRGDSDHQAGSEALSRRRAGLFKESAGPSFFTSFPSPILGEGKKSEPARPAIARSFSLADVPTNASRSPSALALPVGPAARARSYAQRARRSARPFS